ncbi:RNA-binding S4 domain-containing protein [Helicobacter pylori]
MRIDKFLNSTNILKRRSVAQDMCESGVVLLNGKVVKSSAQVKVADIIKLVYLTGSKSYEILSLPTSKTIPKSQSHLYIKELGDHHA